MNKICLLQQECGIGDVFFCQNIAKRYVNEGYKVIWPLSPFVYTIREHLCSDGIEYYDGSTNYPHKEQFQQLYHSKKYIKQDDFVFVPLGYASHIVSEKVMPAKYLLCDMDYKIWKNDINIIRNLEREQRLRSLLNINEGEQYCLVNSNYVTPPDIHTRDVSFAFRDLDITNLKFIHMNILSEFSVFDWCGIIENAKYIVTVDTCIMYFMEFLKLKSEKNCCFPRSGKNTINEIHGLFETPWTYYI